MKETIEWISISDELPKIEDEWVLLRSGEIGEYYYSIGQYYGVFGSEHHFGDGEYAHDNVTHFARLSK